MQPVELSPFDVNAFLLELRRTGCSLGEPFHYFTTTSSTNHEAKALANAGAPHGATCFADFQTSGRGRQGKAWVAQPNAQLLASVLVRGSNLTSSNLTSSATLTLAVGAALHRALRTVVPQETELLIKWPNDIEANGCKLAGILTEAHVTGDEMVTVIGFGVNVWEPPRSTTPMQPIALRTLGCTLPREQLLVLLLDALAEALAQFRTSGLAPLVSYLNQYDALAGARVSVDGLEGRALGITLDGALSLETAHGNSTMSSGTVVRR